MIGRAALAATRGKFSFLSFSVWFPVVTKVSDVTEDEMIDALLEHVPPLEAETKCGAAERRDAASVLLRKELDLESKKRDACMNH